jgi:hypothetical protein
MLSKKPAHFFGAAVNNFSNQLAVARNRDKNTVITKNVLRGTLIVYYYILSSVLQLPI